MRRLDTKVPEFNLLGKFWQNVRDDISGQGCLFTVDHLIHLSYERRVVEERRILKQEARDFIDTLDFIQWADLSGADVDALREDLLYAYLNS